VKANLVVLVAVAVEPEALGLDVAGEDPRPGQSTARGGRQVGQLVCLLVAAKIRDK